MKSKLVNNKHSSAKYITGNLKIDPQRKHICIVPAV